MMVILSQPRCVQLSCVTPPRRCLCVDRFVITVSHRDCHCDSLQLGQGWPPCRHTDTSFWVLPTAINVQIFFYRYALVYMYCYHYFMSLIVMSCDSVYWKRNFFGPKWSINYYYYGISAVLVFRRWISLCIMAKHSPLKCPWKSKLNTGIIASR